MKITSVIENTSRLGLPTEHGLSLYIQSRDGRNILFDMGQGCLFAENAKRLGLSIADVETAIVSHGHYDHGGGLGTFLELNRKAKVYIHNDAFLPHYSLRDKALAYIGIEKKLQGNERIMLCDSITKIDNDMLLFADVHGESCRPSGNKLLFGPDKKENDTFSHEQNLIIQEDDKIVLLAGCAHNGILNIIRKAEEVIGNTPTHVLGGMHLVKSALSADDESNYIESLGKELAAFSNCKFYTMHCTGTEQYRKLKDIMGNQIHYLSCGDSITI